MDASLMSQLKELQDENRRLKKMYADALSPISSVVMRLAVILVATATAYGVSRALSREARKRKVEGAHQAALRAALMREPYFLAELGLGLVGSVAV